MTTASQLPRLLAQIRQCLLRLLKGVRPQVLAQVLRRLRVLWSFFCSRWYSWRKPPRSIGKPPSADLVGFKKAPEALGPSKEKALHSELERREHEYTINPNGEIIPLNDVACSLYPFNADGIRSASRSSHNLSLARSAHNLAITTRNASRSSQRLGSEYSHSALSISSDGGDEGYTFTVQRSPTSPTPARQYSISLPQLARVDNENTRTRPTNQQPEVSSPHEYPPNPTEYSPSRPSPYIHISQLPEVGSPREIDASSIEIPSLRPTDHTETSSIRPSSPFPISQHSRSNSLHEIDATSVGLRIRSAAPIYLENKRIIPVMPEASQRYTSRPRIRKRDTAMTIQPLTTTFENSVPFPWIKYLHPEGGRYFFYEDKRIYTDADLYDSEIFKRLCQDIATLEGFISANRIPLPEHTDLVLDLRYDEDGDIQATYYYAHHKSRTIFFLDTFEAENLSAWSEAPGATTESHLRHEIEAQYWFFLQLFPHSREISQDLICELRDIILFFIGDCMTSPSSTSPYNLDDLHKLLLLADKLQKNLGEKFAGATGLLARLMYMFVHSRFLDFYGEPCSRIERHFSVYGTPIVSRTWLIRSITPFLFSAPDFHLQTLQKMWVDGLMHKAVWDKSVEKMNQEWQEFVLFATVMLNANVAFLAIQSVDSDSDNLPYRSPAQISSYLSVVASIGSIVLGLLLIRQNRTKQRESADEMQKFMSKRSHPSLGLETLAILYSLPYALLMWGMVSFLAAFSFMCFQHSNIHARAVVGPFCFVVAILISWCVWTLWEEQPEEQPVEFAPEPDEKDAQGSCTSSGHAVARPSMLTRLLSLHAFLIRRQSVDSQRTVV